MEVRRKLFRRNLHLPKWFDIPLRGLKYLLLGFFLFVVGAMSAEAIQSFMATPYGLIADVKMLNFFRGMGGSAVIVIALLVCGSILVQNFWCRYLCPYGALMGLVSLLSPVKIRRDAEVCIDCAKCAKACPASLPVDRLLQIRSAECAACMECIAVCPAEDALQLALPPRRSAVPAQRWLRRALSPLAVACLLAYLFVAMVLFARATSHWQTHLPNDVYRDLIPNANQGLAPRHVAAPPQQQQLFFGQGKSEHIAACRDDEVLLATCRIAHRRGMNQIANVKVPQGLAGARIENHKILRIVAVGQQPRRRGHDASPAFVVPICTSRHAKSRVLRSKALI